MNKLFTKIATAFVGIAMAIGVGVAVGSNRQEVKSVSAAGTTNFTTTSSGGFSNNTKTDGGVTVTFGGSPSWQSNHVRVYAGATVSFTSSSENITSIVVSHTSTGSYPISWSSNPSGISSATWTGSSSSVTLTNTSSKQVRLTSIAVTTVASKTLSGIGVSTAPTKTTYLVGETFDPTGLVISRTWSSGNPDTYAYAGHTTEFTFSPTTSTALTTSNTSVTITYGGKSTTQAITVNAPKTPASVSSAGQTTTFEAGDKFAYGGTLTATYTDSTSAGVTPTSFKIGNAGINPTSAGTVIVPGTTALSSDDHNGKTVYVLYTENNTTVYTSYVITVNKTSKITLDPTVTSSFPYQGITLTVTDGTLTNGSDYRVYKNQTMTITSTVGDMAKIEFTYSSESYDGGGWSSAYTPNDDTWTSPTANGEQARITKIIVTLASTDPLVELDVSSATSVSMMKGDPDSSVKVLVKNIDTKTWSFTFDEGGETGKIVSSYISVSAGEAVSDVHTLTITTIATGSTTMHISVSGTACATAVPVTVNAKPASIEIKSGNTLELQSSTGSRSYTKASLTIKDTDGNDYNISSIADVTLTNISGDDCVTISGGTITAKSVGECTVRFSLNVLPSVYTDLAVSVINDYNISINSVIFNSDLMDDQGKTIAHTDIFNTREANTHFGVVADILDSEIKYSYNPNDAANAVSATAFYYDFDHGTTDPEFGEGYKDQTIYVYFSFDNWETVSYTTTFSVIIAQQDIDLESISLDTGSSLSLQRNTSHQLVVSYYPEDATSTREVSYEIVSSSEGSTIEVSSVGLITAGDRPGSSARVKVTSLFSSSIYATVDVEVTLESMTYIVSEEESWTKVNDPSTLTAGDQVILTGVKSDVTYAASVWGGGNNVPADTEHTLTVSGTSVTGVVSSMIYTLETGSEEGSLAFKGSDDKYLCATSSSKNYMHSTSTIDANSSFILDSDGTVVAQGSFTRDHIRYNNEGTSNLFSCYESTSTTGTLVTFYKKNGGDTPYTVTETLFNAVHDNFGDSDTTYTWSETCPSFNLSSWTAAGNAVKGITSFSSYKLNLAVGNISGNEIEVFIAKYDNVVAKFYKDCKTDQEKAALDFLGRVASGKVTPAQRIMILGDNAFNSNTSIIVVIVSLVSAAAVGGYFFLRKKKED